MSGMTDGQQLRNAQWGKVSRLFKPAMIISAALTASAETLYRTGAYPRAIFEAGSTDVRTWLYVALMYLIALPVLFLWMRRLLAGYPMPWNPPLKRWLLGAFSLVLCSGMIVLPAIVLITDRWVSPAAAHARHVLPCHIEAPSAWDSNATLLVLVETLLAAVQGLTWEVTEARMKRLEELYTRTRLFRRYR